MQLYNAPAPNPRRVRIFLAEKGIDVPRVEVDIQGGETRSPQFLAKNKLAGTPIMELDDGEILTESVAICRYLESLYPTPCLMGRSGLEAARVEMWNRRMEIEILGTYANVAQHSFDFFADKIEQVPAFAESQRRASAKKWAWLDSELADGRPFVGGADFSIADITGMAALMVGDFAGIEIPKELNHVLAWSERMRERSSWDA